MSLKVLITAAVPFHASRLPIGMNRNLIETVTEIEKVRNKDSTNSKVAFKSLRRLTAAEKLHLRRLRNKAAAQASREKVKHIESLLNDRLYHLKYEKMKLLLENESLKKQHSELEMENNCLKLKAHSLQFQPIGKENDEEVTFKHASFVSIPLQKEWVLPKIFCYLMLSLWEILKQEVLILNYWIPYISIQQNVNSSLKYLLNFACLPWRLMISPVYLQNLMISNG